MDNVFIERLWRSIKHEDIYLREYATIDVLDQGVKRWMKHYNTWRPHAALGNKTPLVTFRPREGSQIKAKEVRRAA
jgi:putative transposase